MPVRRAVKAALVANLCIAIFKLVAAYVSRSSAMLAESYHSISDTVNQVLLLHGIRAAEALPDENHPFGYGKARYFYSFVVAVMIFGIAGTLSVVEGVNKILSPHALGDVTLGYYALAFAVVFEGYALLVSLREAQEKQRELEAKSLLEGLQRSKDPTLMTVVVEDSVAIVGIAIAGVGLYLTATTGNPIYDAVASLMIGLTLMAFAVVLARENKDLLIGESMDPVIRLRIVRDVEAHPQVVKVVDLKTMHLSPKEALVNIEINFRDGLTTDDVERVINEVKTIIQRAAPAARQVFVEARALHGPPKA